VTHSDTTQLIERLLGPARAELGCDACFDAIDRYVDLQLVGQDADTAVPGMREHLAGCPACREEHESLTALAAEPAPSFS
jgi:predicted anti-sigma-YlaC factor YlaD